MVSKLLDGRYQILEVIESDEFGNTYLATDTRRPGEAQCFVKHLKFGNFEPKLIDTYRRRFNKEALILEKLSQHDKIPKLYAYFEQDREFFLVESYVPGEPLDAEIIPGKPLEEQKVIDILNEMLEILVFVHGNGVIHRDIKPSNLIRRESDGKLVLIDFGAVKEIQNGRQGQSSPTVRIGTIEYMPIEQFEYNPQLNSDIYALGMMGIQAITGLPAEEISKLKYARNGKTREIDWHHLAVCSSGLADILDKMVRYDYRDRYQSAAEVIADLKKVWDAPKLASDKRKTYAEEVVRLASYRGDISVVGRKILDALRDSWELAPEEAEKIEDEVLNPYRKYQEKGQQYEQALLAAIKQEYPFSKETKEELKRLQQILGLSDEDAVLIEKQIAPNSPIVQLKKAFQNFQDSQVISNKKKKDINQEVAQLSPQPQESNARQQKWGGIGWWFLGVSIVGIMAIIVAIYADIQRRNLQQRLVLEEQQRQQEIEDTREFNTINTFYSDRNYQDCIAEAAEVDSNSTKFNESQSLLQKCQGGLKWQNAAGDELVNNYGVVRKVAFHPNGQILASKGTDNSLEILDPVTSRRLKAFPGDSSAIWSADFNPNGDLLAVGTYFWQLIVWNIETDEGFPIFDAHEAPVWSVAISLDGKTLVSSAGDIVTVWDLETRAFIKDLYHHDDTVYTVAITPDNTTLVSGSEDTTIKIVNLGTGDFIRTLEGHKGGVRSVAISPDGKKIVSGSYDDTVKIWNLETGKLIRSLEPHSGDVISVAISPDGKFIASGSKDKTVKVWDLETGDFLKTLDGHTDEVYSVAFSPDSQFIVSGSKDNTIRLWQK